MSRKAKRVPWKEADLEKLQTVTLPPKIKCGRCSKHLSLRSYSERQLNDYRYQCLHEGRVTKPINCQKCTGGQITEIECVVCHKTKGLEDFAKSQRQDADTARCFECTEELVTRKPVREESYGHSTKSFVKPVDIDHRVSNYFGSASSADGCSTTDGWNWTDEKSSNTTGGVSLPRQFHNLSVSDSESEVLIDGGNPCLIGQGSGTGTGSWHTAPTDAASTSTGSASNTRGSEKPAVASNRGTERSYASSVAERSDNRSGGCVKVPRGPAVMRPSEDVRRELEEDVYGWEAEEGDEDDEEEDEDDDDDDDDDTVI